MKSGVSVFLEQSLAINSVRFLYFTIFNVEGKNSQEPIIILNMYIRFWAQRVIFVIFPKFQDLIFLKSTFIYTIVVLYNLCI